MNAKIQCAAPDCQRLFDPNPRVKNQRYCDAKDCQRARKRQWQKEKLAADPDYKANQRDCQREWHLHHPDYYKEYRQNHPTYCQRNTLLQTYRNTKARVIAKMDAFKPAPIKYPDVFYMLASIAKMDALTKKFFLIPTCYGLCVVIAKEDSIDSRVPQC